MRVAGNASALLSAAFIRLKHRLRLETVSGLDYLVLQQDFGAKILADNLCTLLSDLDVAGEDVRRSLPKRLYALGALKPIFGSLSAANPTRPGQTRRRAGADPAHPMPDTAIPPLLDTTQKSEVPLPSRVQTRVMQWVLS